MVKHFSLAISFERLKSFFLHRALHAGEGGGNQMKLRSWADWDGWREFNEPFSCWLYYKKCNPISKMKKGYQR